MKKLLRLFAVSVLLFCWSAQAEQVVEVRVVHLGQGKIDPQAVLAYTRVKVGDEFTRMAVSHDVKALQRSGRFSFVSTRVEEAPDGYVLIYEVTLRPRLRKVDITGNDIFSVSKIRDIMELEDGIHVDDTFMTTAVQKLKDRYVKKHRPFAQIRWEVVEVPDTLLADVILKIEEGQKAVIKKIAFEGGEAIKPRQLKKGMQQKPWHIFSWLTGSGKFDPDLLSGDLEGIRKAYLDAGYLDVVVLDPVVESKGKSGVAIKIPVDQGPLYSVGKTELKGATIFPVEDLQREVKLTEGAPAGLDSIVQAAQRVEDYYGSRGYMRTRVTRHLVSDPDTQVVNMVFEIKEGTLTYLRNIEIKGNTRTKDKVIRRELVIYPGEKYDQVRIRKSEQRLRNLGYFNMVFATPEPTGDEDFYDLSFTVEEKKTGQFVIGAGFSSVDDLVGFVELSQGNFDIFGNPNFTGGGQKIKTRAQVGTSRNDVEVSFTEPWFMDRQVSLTLAGFHSERGYESDEYDEIRTGGSATLGKQLFGYNRAYLRYGFERIEIADVDEDASQQIKDEEGVRNKSYITLEHIYDSRDSVFVPTRGLRLASAVTVAGGPLGADTDLYLLESKAEQYVPLWFDHVLSFRGSAAVVEEYGDSDRVPIFDREFLGGARTLRGFEYRDVGPKDEFGEPLGGRSSWFGSIEYTIPIVDKIRLATFFDIGMVEELAYEFDFSHYNSDYGVGVRFDIPSFPLRLDYAWPIEADEFNDDSSGRFNFLIGYTL